MKPTAPRASASDLAGRALFACAILASAFLIFLVQPMVGKRILPWFGGAQAVWTLCLAFYQTTLFAGYAYAHLLIRYTPPRAQLWIHILVFGAAMLALPVLPDDSWRPDGGGAPSSYILLVLAAHVALPFLALASTGPLIQAWFARRHPDASPYPLYAVSNFGSLGALLGYPFLLEPRLTLSTSGSLWSFAFVLTGVLVLACAWLASQHSAATPEAEADARPAPLQPARVALWIALAGCAVVVMMGVTNMLCLDLASVPFLWILPLATYLLTFILAFGSDRPNRRWPYIVIAVLPLALPYLVDLLLNVNAGVVAVMTSIQAQVVAHCLVLFGVCMVLHGELHRLRPRASSLTAFYLCVSGGGAIGGIFVGIVAPQILDDYRELPLGIVLACFLFLAAYSNDPRGRLHRLSSRWRWTVAVLLVVPVTGFLAFQWLPRPEEVVYQERTFFGVLRVNQLGVGQNVQHQLLSGSTTHGLQIAAAEDRPTSYYGVLSGIGLALSLRELDVPANMGVVGLGVGTLAAYGRPNDRVRFYEIDPAIIRIARDQGYFTYLSASRAEIEIVEGDGRLSLAQELREKVRPPFDTLVIDAFSSDAIPVHLLTREAFALYMDSLVPTGLLAVHVSSQHLDLTRIVAKLGEDAGLHVLMVQNQSMPRRLTKRAEWMFLARDAAPIEAIEALAEQWRTRLGRRNEMIRTLRWPAEALSSQPLWTDDYSDLLGAVEPIRVRFSLE